MAKYSFELKKKIVLEYLNEEVGYKTLVLSIFLRKFLQTS